MPASGEQHKASSASTNPFEEAQPRISEYTAQEIATLQSRLNRQLGPEYISARAGPAGGKVHYVPAGKCIQLANEVFGFNGWSSSIREVQVDYVEEVPATGKFNMGISVIMRVVLRDGTYHEDIGYGHVENCKSKALGFEKTKKEATTDALKRALRNFGNVLGNCIYDKDYISKVTKIRVAPTKFDINSLHRHSDHAPVKKEISSDEGSKTSGEQGYSTENYEGEDEFGADFDEVDFGVTESAHPDEVSAEGPTASTRFPRPSKNVSDFAQQRSLTAQNFNPGPPGGPMQGILPSAAVPNVPATRTAQQQQQQASNLNAAQRQPIPPPPRPQQPQVLQQPRPPQSHVPAPTAAPIRPSPLPTSNNPPANGLPPITDPAIPSNAPVGFFTARAAERIQAAPATLPDNAVFNPHAETPSIPRTPGFDHTRSKPVAATRDIPGAAPQQQPQPANQSLNQPIGQRPNFVNPHLDSARRIGMPGAMGTSPLQNRSSYKVPTLKRPAEGAVGPNPAPAQALQQRPALADVTGSNTNVPSPAQAQAQAQAALMHGKGEPPEKRQRGNGTSVISGAGGGGQVGVSSGGGGGGAS